MDLEAAKRDLRQRMSERRRAVSVAEAESAGRLCAQWIQTSDAYRSAPTLGLYVALPGEPSTRALFDRATSDGKRVCVVRTREGRRLEFAQLGRWDALVPGRFSVPEAPPEAERCQLEARDLVIVPGLAFDSAGRRLGRGGGYYDRAFPPDADASPTLVGLGFSFQLVAQVPAGCHDRRMDAVCTELALHWASAEEVT